MRRKMLIALAAVAAVGIGAFVFYPEKKDPALTHLEEGTRLWKDAVWHPDRTRFAQAVAPLDRALRFGRKDPDLYFMLAVAVFHEGGSDNIVPLLRELQRIDPKHPGLPLADGLWEERKRQPRTARNAFSACVTALEAWTHDAPLREEIEFMARRGRSATDTHLGSFNRAAEDYEFIFDALERHGGRPTPDDYLGYANAHFRLQENPKAIELLERGLKEWPAHPHLLLSRALILADERAEGAQAALRQVAAVDPNNPSILFKLAELARKNGQLPQMYLRLTEVRALIDRLADAVDPHDVKTWNAEYLGGLARYHLDLGYELRAAGNVEGAKESFRTALARAQESAGLWDACFRVHSVILRLGELIDVPADVLDHSRRAYDLRPEQAPSVSDASRTFC